MNNGKPAWLVDLGKKQVGRRMRVIRATKAKAEQAAREEVDEWQEHGSQGDFVTTEERAFVLRWRGKFGPWSAVDRILETHQTIKIISVEEAVAAYRAAPRARPLKPRTVEDISSRLGAFAAAFAGRSLETLRAGELEAYFLSKGGAAPNHYANVSALMNHAARHDWIPANPLAKIVKPRALNQEKTILTPDQMIAALLFSASAGLDSMLRALVFGGFVGLRVSEVDELDCSDVNLKKGDVFVRDMKTEGKGVSSRHVPLEPNALAWVRWLQLPRTGKVLGCTAGAYRSQRDALCKALKIDWPHNVLRRSHGSYHLAEFEDAALTAERMGHTDAKTTKAKYRVVCRQETADEWFSIVPRERD